MKINKKNYISIMECFFFGISVLKRAINLCHRSARSCLFFEKSLFKLFCVYLLLGKLINGKHFPVNGKYFPVKEKFGLVSRKVFSLLVVFVFRKVIFGKPLSKLSCVCLPLENLVNGKYFSIKEKFDLVFRKVFSWKIWAENTFRKL